MINFTDQIILDESQSLLGKTKENLIASLRTTSTHIHIHKHKHRNYRESEQEEVCALF